MAQPKEILLGNSEEELIAACKAGRRVAQKRIYELFAPKMVYICRRYAKDMEQARDFMHDGFIKVFLNITKFRGESSLETWVTRIMINNSITAIKKEVRKGIKVKIEDVKLKDSESFDFELEAKQPIRAQQVFDTLEELPIGYRTVISLYILDGFTHKEIGDQLGISEGTSKSQLAKGKKLLASRLKEKYQ
ncbi:MAG: RNA polymerase sigma factor [Owenweeksia sp.]|nr:RNA polymerase sigma factor [Owenweeksia sp.]